MAEPTEHHSNASEYWPQSGFVYGFVLVVLFIVEQALAGQKLFAFVGEKCFEKLVGFSRLATWNREIELGDTRADAD